MNNKQNADALERTLEEERYVVTSATVNNYVDVVKLVVTLRDTVNSGWLSFNILSEPDVDVVSLFKKAQARI
jgi:hypothetical protein